MKTKIIYISGNETFEMADIRAAFDEVRATLGLDKNTVLFGVPVDEDDALAKSNANNDNLVKQDTEEVQVYQEPVIDEKTVEIQPAPVETKEPVKTPRKRKSSVNTTEKAKENLENKKDTDEKVIPILSILSSGPAETQPEIAQEEVAEPVQEISEPEEDDVVDTIALEEDSFDEVQDDIQDTEDEIAEEIVTDIDDVAEEGPAEILLDDSEEFIDDSDFVEDEEPAHIEHETSTEKTLEELLESMTPLREDKKENEIPSGFGTEDVEFSSDNDATLEQLANEFAETQETIVVKNNTESHGKIGKLKNILPFKKAKKEDPGVMGDLFGWAGIAANDEEITIPDFFTNAASKK